MKYTSISDILKKEYGQKVYRLSLQSGCGCPNRDGTIGVGGCTFCSEGGSGDFAAPLLPLDEQIRLARKRVDAKISDKIPIEDRKYIAYFQSYTNTWGDRERLKCLYDEAIHHSEICILSVATRPDCIDNDWISYFSELNKYKPVWIELGLQTVNDKTADHFLRGYKTEVYESTYKALKEAGLTVITHIILGLPGEGRNDMRATVKYVKDLYESFQRDYPDIRSDGVKLQLLHILKGTKLYEEYKENPFHILTPEEYTEIIIDSLRVLGPEVVIHRLTGDGPKRLLVAPLWSADKKRVLNMLTNAIKMAL
ncbi:MAG: TIGR01212 family radical SAM protein [Catonella sp.]|nr:TIGR01212 family radical SAM protein [Catonella sp.]MDY6357706.1 TIGR01212 family radical SAM protein [Catonella sp.]